MENHSMIEEYHILDKAMDVPLNTIDGKSFLMGAYKTIHNERVVEHILIYKGDIINSTEPIMVRINSACFTSDIFGCNRCDCNWQLNKALDLIHDSNGLLIYHLHHEGRGVGITNKLKSYMQMDTYHRTTCDAFRDIGLDPDIRYYASSSIILKDLNIRQIRLISNNPKKKVILEKYGISVVDTISLISDDPSLKDYLISKRDQFGHTINL